MKPWFKFYKQAYLTDTKIMSMDPLLRLIWVTLLCLADDNGEIDYLREVDLIRLAGCESESDIQRTTNCLEFFQERGMITLQTVTDRNAGVTYRVTLCNYLRHQEENFSNAERQKRYREKLKIASKTVTKQRNGGNVTQRNDSNARIDKNRIDKNILPALREKVDKISSKSNHPYQDIIAYCLERQGITQGFPNYVKQTTAVKKILSSGYAQDDLRFVIDEMVKDPFWIDNPFDLMNVANQMHKYMNRTVMFGKGKQYAKAS